MPPNFRVRLTEIGPNETRVIKRVRVITRLNLAEAKRIVQQLDVVKKNLNRREAVELQRRLEEAGATARIEPQNGGGAQDGDGGRDGQRPLSGAVRDINTAESVSDARIVAKAAGNVLGETTTDGNGQFVLETFGQRVQEFFPSMDPQVEFSVFRWGREVNIRHKPFNWDRFRAGHAYVMIDAEKPSSQPDPPDSPDPKGFRVHGRVVLSEDGPAAGITVKAFDRDLRDRQILGQTKTDETGAYQITYMSDQFQRAEKQSADLVLHVYHNGKELDADWDRDGDILFNAGGDEEVNLTVLDPEALNPSEYERLMAELSPLLQDVELVDLTDEDISFLHGDTGIDGQRLQFLTDSHQLAGATALPPEFFYGVARQDKGMIWQAGREPGTGQLALKPLLQYEGEVVRQTIEAAIEARVIPRSLTDEMEDMLAAFSRLRNRQKERERQRWPQYELTGRVINEATGDPLPQHTVEMIIMGDAFQGDWSVETTTGGQGTFELTYRLPTDQDRDSLDIRLTVVSPGGEELVVQEREIDPREPEPIELEITPVSPAEPGVDVSLTEIPVDVPADLSEVLQTHDIHTLADVRRSRDLEQVISAPVDPGSLTTLRAHANLSLLPTDVDTHSILINNGFQSLEDIAGTPRQEFIGSVEHELNGAEAVRVHRAASAQTFALDNMVTTALTDRTNGLQPTVWEGVESEAIAPLRCTCSDCESALSPGAYLVDLIDYVLSHVRVGGEPISLEELTDTFHQPFSDLPVSCDASQEKVRQVRLCVEVLLKHLGEDGIQFLARTDDGRAQYRLAAYDALLAEAGASREELELALNGTNEDQRALARRLGINGDHLNQLWLDPEGAPGTAGTAGTAQALSERNLERIFGLRATTYIESTGDPARVTIPDPLRNVDQPLLAAWRREHLHQSWQTQDHPEDLYQSDQLPVIDPDVIGPDDFRHPDPAQSEAFRLWVKRREWVDGQLNQLRNQTQTVDGEGVPGVGAMFNLMYGTNTITYDNQRFDGPWVNAHGRNQLDGLYDQVIRPGTGTASSGAGTGSSSTGVQQAHQTIEEVLHLSSEGFIRMMEIRRKHEEWLQDPRNEPVDAGQWEEFYSILVQAQKTYLYPTWIQEEPETLQLGQSQDVFFSPHRFWLSLTEPEEGNWSSVLDRPLTSGDRPLLDPQRLSLDDLPDVTAGSIARTIWQQRQASLENQRRGLESVYEQQNIDALLDTVYGDPPVGTDWQEYFETRRGDLDARDGDVDALTQTIASELFIGKSTAIDGFRTLETVRIKSEADRDSGIEAPADAELDEMYTLLTTAWKRKEQYPTWMTEEQQQNLTYWQVYKARLPAWRSSQKRRQQWQQSLHRRSDRPVIDPDQLVADALANPIPSDPAFRLWQERTDWLSRQMTALENTTGNSPQVRFDTLLVDTVGITRQELRDLRGQETDGRDVTARLDQLTLTPGAFHELVRTETMLETNQSLDENRWETLYHLLLQIRKRRGFARWQRQERQEQMTLSPAFFTLTPHKEWLSAYDDHRPSQWRRDVQAWRDWRDRLDARETQQARVLAKWRNAVDAVEKETLPQLRDTLIAHVTVPASETGPNARAEWVTDRLLIDAREDGCRNTTRISQAIETLQSFVFALRSGTGLEWPGADHVALEDEHFREQWRWMGSYAAWKAGMAVFLYPQNILYPTLRRDKTPGFHDCMEMLARGDVSVNRIEEATEQYSRYLQDVTSLTMKASCSVGDSSESRKNLYLFAETDRQDGLYWSQCLIGDDDEIIDQSFWMRVPGLDDYRNEDVLGAISYRDRIYLFFYGREEDEDERTLAYLTLDVFQLPPGKDGTESEVATLWSEPEAVKLNDTDIEDAVVARRNNSDIPPALVIEAADKLFYVVYMNDDGDEWEPPTRLELREWEGEYEGDFDVYHGSDRDGAFYTLKSAFIGRRDMLDPEDRHNVIVFVESGSVDDVRGISSRNYSCFVLHPWLETLRAISTPDGGRQVFVGSRNVLYGSWLGVAGSGDPVDSFYVFWRGEDGIEVKHLDLNYDGRVESNTDVNLTGLNLPVGPLSVHCHNSDAAESLLLQPPADHALAGPYFVPVEQAANDRLTTTGEVMRMAPLLSATPANVRLLDTDRERRSRKSQLPWEFAFNQNLGRLHVTHPSRVYLEEAFYHLPIYFALRLQQSGRYEEALDWIRQCYDYGTEEGERKIFPFEQLEAGGSSAFSRSLDWLEDPIDPHAIASLRPQTYLRYTLFSVIQCLLDYADEEFSQDTATSVARARSLYTTALDVLDGEVLKQGVHPCDDLTLDLDVGIMEPEIAETVQPVMMKLEAQIAEINDYRLRKTTLASVKEQLQGNAPVSDRFETAIATAKEAQAEDRTSPTLTDTLNSESGRFIQTYQDLLARDGMARTVQGVGQAVDWQMPVISEEIGEAGSSASDVPDYSDAVITPIPERIPSFAKRLYDFCIPTNPVLESLRLHAENNLRKIRTCRNIAGMERELEPYSAPTDAASSIPSLGSGGQLTIPSGVITQPTPYRYETLVNRAKELVNLARQMEGELLRALERRDEEALQLLKTRQEVEQAEAGVRLQDLRVREATAGVELAGLQLERAEIQSQRYSEWIENGLNRWERTMIESYRGAGAARMMATHLDAAAQLAQATASASLQGTAALPVVAIATMATAMAREVAISYETRAQVASVHASYERRKQQWQLERDLAQQDRRISSQRIRQAELHVDMAEQERDVAALQAEHAGDVVEFLASQQETTAELYQWMSQVLEGVYRYFLQQATAMAKLAEQQQAFERQQTPASVIQSDYWHLSSQGQPGQTSGDGDEDTDRHGLTGSARLLQDIYRLDQHAFETDQRKLQLKKTISLAQLDPVAFERFRETGVLTFATPMEMFDRDHPGHFLRLIRHVSTSVLALTPPTDGIKATLTNSGISRVVTGGNLFQTRVIRRDPELIALSSPQNDDGLFELRPDPEMLLPFEKTGVDTMWEFRMPPAANAFDYDTIADVLLTIEYTALASDTYRRQVTRELDPEVSADRAYSFRQEFADQWYDLNNPEVSTNPMTVTFDTRKGDFPPNLNDLAIENILLYFVPGGDRSVDEPFEADLTTRLRFTGENGQGSVEGDAAPVEHVISTRRGNGSGWLAMTGRLPVGRWELSLPDTPEVKRLFEKDQIEDILFVITYEGETPSWS